MSSFRCNGFMDMETGTNPIDRSVAHLLFHRPSYPSLVPGSNDVSSPKSSAMVIRIIFVLYLIKGESEGAYLEKDDQLISVLYPFVLYFFLWLILWVLNNTDSQVCH